MSGDDVRPGTEAPNQRAEPHPERLDADQIELRRHFRGRMAEPPAGVIFAKPGRLDQRRGFKFEGVVPGVANDFQGQDCRAPERRKYDLSRQRLSTQGFKPGLSRGGNPAFAAMPDESGRNATEALPLALAGTKYGGYKPAVWSRSVAQPGSAHRSGRWGRRFKSCHSDQKKQRLSCSPEKPRSPGKCFS